jgi:hypothetical protein
LPLLPHPAASIVATITPAVAHTLNQLLIILPTPVFLIFSIS